MLCGFSNLEAAAQIFSSSAPPVISLLRSVLSACRGGSFGVAPHALASCHFSPRSPRGHGEAWRFKSLSPALQEGLPRGPCHVPAPPVCLQLVVTSTSTERAATPPALSLGRRQARGRSQPTLFLIVVKYRKHRFSVLLTLPSPIPRGNGCDSWKWLAVAHRCINSFHQQNPHCSYVSSCCLEIY